MSADSHLIDTDGHEYKKKLMGFTGGTLRDRHDVNSDQYFGQGSIFTFFYELPIKARPSNLRLNYSHLTSLDEKTEQNGQIDIKISPNKR
jgi:hypothetical protein